jgi:hypothetical protein
MRPARVLLTVATVLLTTSLFAATSRRVAAPAAARPMTIDNAGSCDLSNTPSATLLLPYFEVELGKRVNDAANTIFTIINTSSNAQISRVTIWTDYGYPAAWFNIFMKPYDVQAISLWDVISLGRLPKTSNAGIAASNPHFIVTESCASAGGDLPAEMLESLQSMLTTGTRSADVAECRVGGSHAMAIGYVTVDVVNSCVAISPLDIAYYSQILLFDNVLTGDYERINPDVNVGNYAGGNPLVHIKAVPEGGPAGSGSTGLPYTFYDRFTPTGGRKVDRRQPLPSAFAARFIQGGTGKFQTDYAVWREAAAPAVASCATPSSASMAIASVVRFDESENPMVGGGTQSATTGGIASPMSLPSTAAPPTASSIFPPLSSQAVSGWMYLNLDNRAGGITASSTSAYSTARPSQNWVIIHMRAEGRYGVDYNATTLANGCTPTGGAEVMIAPKPEVPKGVVK